MIYLTLIEGDQYYCGRSSRDELTEIRNLIEKRSRLQHQPRSSK